MDYKAYLESHLTDVADIGDAQFVQLTIYLDELLRWNKKVNLTAIVELNSCWEKHILDSLFLGSMLAGRERLVDIGSGAGLPSIPLKIVFPGLRVLSVDSVTKKINFQRHVVRLLGLHDFSAEAARIEDLEQQHCGQFDVVTSRAFASLEVFVKHALPFLNRSGRILAMKSITVEDEIGSASEYLFNNDLYISNKISFTLPSTGAKRTILEIRMQK